MFMEEKAATDEARAKYRLQYDVHESLEFIRELDARKEMTVRCTLTHVNGEDWTFTGPAEKALQAQKKHRWNHKSLRRNRSRKQAAAPNRR